MEFRLARRLMVRRPLTVVLQVAALLLGFLTAGVGFALHGMLTSGGTIPGAAYGAQARWLALQTDQGDWQSRFTPAQAHALRQVLGIPVYPAVYTRLPVRVGNTRIASTVLGINPDALAALGVKISSGHLPAGRSGGAVLGAAVASTHVRIGRADVAVAGWGTDFRGLAASKNPAEVFVPLATLARAGFDPQAIKMPTLALFVSAQTAKHLPGDAQLTRLVRGRPDLFPTAKRVHLTHNLGHYGGEDYALDHYSRALGVLGTVLLLLGLLNVATYQLGRQADLAWRSKLLRDVGAGRLALRVLAYTEPVVVTMGALLLAWLALIPMLRVVLYVLDARNSAAHVQPTVASYACIFGLALALAVVLGEIRYRATGNVRSRSIRRVLAAYFTYASMIQAFACIAVLGLALAATVTYLRALPAQPNYHVDNVRVYTVALDVKKLPGDLVLRWPGALQRLGDRVHGVAATSLWFMPASYYSCCASGIVRYKGRRISTTINYVTPGYFKVLGMHLESGKMFGFEALPHKPGTVGPSAIINHALARQLALSGGYADHVTFNMKTYTYSGLKRVTIHAQGMIRAHGRTDEDTRAADAANPVVYLPMPAFGFPLDYFRLLVRHAPNIDTIAVDAATRKMLGKLVPGGATIRGEQDLQTIVDSDTAPQRARALLFNVLALGALALTLCGIGGISLFQLELDRQSLAVRSSLGASMRTLAGRHALRVSAPLLAGTVLGAMALAYFGRQGFVYLGIDAMPAWRAAAIGGGMVLACIVLAVGVTLRLLVRADLHAWLRAE